MSKYLNGKLVCPMCGTTTLDIPDNAEENTGINCSHCQRYLGRWGDLLDDFYMQIGAGVFDIKEGRFERK